MFLSNALKSVSHKGKFQFCNGGFSDHSNVGFKLATAVVRVLSTKVSFCCILMGSRSVYYWCRRKGEFSGLKWWNFAWGRQVMPTHGHHSLM